MVGGSAKHGLWEILLNTGCTRLQRPLFEDQNIRHNKAGGRVGHHSDLL
jgi:hypothetical protein